VIGADVSAVIVTWNPGASLGTCVDHLRRSARVAATRVQIVIVDNGSTDGAVDELRLEPADVVIRNGVNAGYGVAAAQGIARANAPWTLLLNTDCRIEEEFLPALQAAAEAAGDDVATLVPDMRFASAPSVINCRGVAVDAAGVPHEIDAGVPAEQAPVREDVFGGSSGCCLLRVDAVRAVGGPEPVFFAYLEDVDLAWRLRRARYRAVFVPGALALHEGSASTREGSALKTYLVARNRRVLFRLDGPHALGARLGRLPVEAGHLAVSLSTGSGLAALRGRLAALRLRRYANFVRRSRTASAYGSAVEPRLPPRATLSGTLARKRALRRHLNR
jgi:GT2 family glycosyltransferase